MHATTPDHAPLTETARTPADGAQVRIDELDGWHNPDSTITSFSWICYYGTEDSDRALPTAA